MYKTENNVKQTPYVYKKYKIWKYLNYIIKINQNNERINVNKSNKMGRNST